MSEVIEGFEVPETDSYTIRPEEKKFTPACVEADRGV